MVKTKKGKWFGSEEEAESPVKNEEEVALKVDLMNPPFDPDIPEQKQRWLR